MKAGDFSIILGTEEKECLNSWITFPTAIFSMVIYFHGDSLPPPHTHTSAFYIYIYFSKIIELAYFFNIMVRNKKKKLQEQHEMLVAAID